MTIMKNIDLIEMLSNIKIVISEIDGVITDGKMAVTETSTVAYKNYSIKDFEAINLLKRDYKFVFMSASNSVNHMLCASKNIPFFWAQRDKKEVLHKILQRYSFSIDEVLYIGANPSDLPMVTYVPVSMCPRDAFSVLKNHCVYRYKSKGGSGVMCELYEMLNRRRYEDNY